MALDSASPWRNDGKVVVPAWTAGPQSQGSEPTGWCFAQIIHTPCGELPSPFSSLRTGLALDSASPWRNDGGLFLADYFLP